MTAQHFICLAGRCVALAAAASTAADGEPGGPLARPLVGAIHRDAWQKPGAGLDRCFASSTPTELAALVREAADWVDAHPGQCPARAVLIYAWNEHDEGGWLCPTLGADGSPDTSRLDALAAMKERAAGSTDIDATRLDETGGPLCSAFHVTTRESEDAK